jgi:hypothetical protein
MKKNIFGLMYMLVAFSLTPLMLMGQATKPQNVYRVTVISQYAIENGKYTSKSFPLFQHIYDSLGRLHTEIDYNIEKNYPSNYRWHYFDDQTKKKTDYYINEKLTRIDEFDYNGNRLSELKVYNVNETDTSLYVRVEYEYDSNGLISKTAGYNKLGKRGYRTSHKYDINGNEIERKVKGKKAIPPDSILYLAKEFAYDSLNRIVSEKITTNKLGKQQSIKLIDYKYDKNSNVIEKQISDSAGNLIKRKEFVYRPDNRLQRRSIFDAENNLIQFRAWRYEIYKTANRRVRVLE